MEHFSADDLFRMSDNGVPIQTEKAIRGLIAPFESLFPDSRVPVDVEAALPFLSKPARHTLKQPPPFYKKEWIEWILWEMKLRLELAVSFLNLAALKTQSQNPPPIILFLREFRGVSHNTDGDILIMTGGEQNDIQLRERIEEMFPQCFIFWLANPKDAISYCFTKKVNQNSYPYFSSQDWLESVEILAKSANLIIMANTSTAKFLSFEVDPDSVPTMNSLNSRDAINKEISILEKHGLVDKTFFSDAKEVKPQLGQVKRLVDLTHDCIPSGVCGNYDNILNLPLTEHWLGIKSIEYAGNFIGAIDKAWGHAIDKGKVRMTGDVIAAQFMAMGALAIVRGELTAAAELHLDLANMMRHRPNFFNSIDTLAEDALRESAKWYQNNARLFSTVYRINFSAPPV